MVFQKALCFCIVLVVMMKEVAVSQYEMINVNATIRSWGNKQLFPPHLIPNEGLSTTRAIVRKKIVLYHNFFRTKVWPPASNMLLMSWHPGAARQAQRYAEQCKFLVHNPGAQNTVPRLGQCGQNLFVAAQKTPWFFAVKSWFLEYRNFTFGSPAFNLHDVGHYTMMVWATSHKVGCGVAYCAGGPWGRFYNYVCHYCPGGNVLPRIEYPYKPGRPCSECPNNCVGGHLCTNPCYERDTYSNCEDLIHVTGICRSGNCNATCDCGNTKVHKNYPWG